MTTRPIAPPPRGYLYVEDAIGEDGQLIHGIASRIGVRASTYKKMRMRGEGPQTTRWKKRIIARVADVDAWVAAQVEAAFAEAEQADQNAARDKRPAEPKLHRRATPRAA